MNAPKHDTPKPNDTPSAAPASSQSTTAALDADVDAHVTPAALEVALGGHQFRIEPMKVRQVFPFLQLARPIFAALTQRPSSPQPALPPAVAGPGQGGDPSAADAPDVAQVNVEAALNDADWMLDAIDNHGPSLVKALAVGIGEDDHTKLEDLTVVDLVVLAKHFVTVNAGFFAARGLRLPQSLPGIAAGAAAPNPATGKGPAPRKR